MVVLYCARPNTPRSNPYDLGELEKPLRDAIYTAMLMSPRRQAGGTSGLALVSGYRDPGRQWDLRVERVGRRDACNPARRANPATAVPGASKHQTREAADIGGVDLPWLIRNAARFGLKRTVPSENWHYEAIGTPTVKITPYPGKTYDGQPVFPNLDPPKPAPPATPKDWFDMATEKELETIVRKVVKEEIADLESAALTTLAEQRNANAIVVSRLGAILGWAKAHALKAGVTRDQAVANDPNH